MAMPGTWPRYSRQNCAIVSRLQQPNRRRQESTAAWLFDRGARVCVVVWGDRRSIRNPACSTTDRPDSHTGGWECRLARSILVSSNREE